MKKINKLISLLFVLVLIMGLPLTASADSTISFNGFENGFDFSNRDLFASFKSVMPGDVLTENITFTNNSKDSDFVNLYLKAEVEDVNESYQIDFLSKLKLKVYNGTEVIYDDTADETSSLTDYKLLGTFRSGETATLTAELTVPTNLGNMYAGSLGNVDWIFHVEAYNESQLTARKIWSDGNDNHKDESVTINLLKDGEVSQTAELSEQNNWAYTFDKLLEGYSWTVEEASVPNGYEVSYDTVGNVTTITNKLIENPTPTPTPSGETTDLTVNKSWSGDSESKRPTSVTVALYNGSKEYQTVTLDVSNNWSYTWQKLDASGNWQILESNIPNGYTPSYSKSGSIVNITNTRSLVQTGQNNMPIFVFGGFGLVLVAFGIIILLKKKKKND